MRAGSGDEDEITWQERFRQALSGGDEEAAVKALREVRLLDRSAIEALANLFEGRAKDHGGWSDVYEYKLVFRPRGRLVGRKGSMTTRPQLETSQQIELTSDRNPEKIERSPEQRFREALSTADASAVVAVLRETESLDRRAVDTLVYLFDVTTKHSSSWEGLRRHKLVFRRKRRGAPKDLEKHWVRDPQIAAFVEHKTDKFRKAAVFDAGKEFKLGRSSIFSAMARKGSRG